MYLIGYLIVPYLLYTYVKKRKRLLAKVKHENKLKTKLRDSILKYLLFKKAYYNLKSKYKNIQKEYHLCYQKYVSLLDSQKTTNAIVPNNSSKQRITTTDNTVNILKTQLRTHGVIPNQWSGKNFTELKQIQASMIKDPSHSMTVDLEELNEIIATHPCMLQEWIFEHNNLLCDCLKRQRATVPDTIMKLSSSDLKKKQRYPEELYHLMSPKRLGEFRRVVRLHPDIIRKLDLTKYGVYKGADLVELLAYFAVVHPHHKQYISKAHKNWFNTLFRDVQMAVMKYEQGVMSTHTMRNPMYSRVLHNMCVQTNNRWNIRVYDTELKCYGTIIGPSNDHENEYVIFKMDHLENKKDSTSPSVVSITRLEYADCYEGDHVEPTLIQMSIAREVLSKPNKRKPQVPGMHLLLQEGRNRLKSIN